MFSVAPSLRSLLQWRKVSKNRMTAPMLYPKRVKILVVPFVTLPSSKVTSVSMYYDASRDLLGLDADQPQRSLIPRPEKLRSWFGPNGQYIRELPCPSCRGRGYSQCAECGGIERSRKDCTQCVGKGLQTCPQCMGECVIWEESIDERPWEKARSSSPLKVKEDDEIDKLEISVEKSRKSKRVYLPPSPEVRQKISRSLKSLNAKTGLLTNRMKIIHSDPKLHARRMAAVKEAKGTTTARKHASETMKAYFQYPENREKRSKAMKGVKFFCGYCGEEGHRMFYCPAVREASGPTQFRCGACGKQGHNRRTCSSSNSSLATISEPDHQSSSCLFQTLSTSLNESRRAYYCRVCSGKGHNRRTCSKIQDNVLLQPFYLDKSL